MDSDVAYYTRRVVEEREAVSKAATEKSRQCHLVLATAYETRLKELTAKKPRATLHIATAA